VLVRRVTPSVPAGPEENPFFSFDPGFSVSEVTHNTRNAFYNKRDSAILQEGMSVGKRRPETQYCITFEGRFLPGSDREQVERNLAALFKTTAEGVRRHLLTGNRMVLKRNLTRELAKRSKAALTRAGAACTIVSQVPEGYDKYVLWASEKRDGGRRRTILLGVLATEIIVLLATLFLTSSSRG
jgi:hypothetical protein